VFKRRVKRIQLVQPHLEPHAVRHSEGEVREDDHLHHIPRLPEAVRRVQHQAETPLAFPVGGRGLVRVGGVLRLPGVAAQPAFESKGLKPVSRLISLRVEKPGTFKL
jgi:hypothetical protein